MSTLPELDPADGRARLHAVFYTLLQLAGRERARAVEILGLTHAAVKQAVSRGAIQAEHIARAPPHPHGRD